MLRWSVDADQRPHGGQAPPADALHLEEILDARELLQAPAQRQDGLGAPVADAGQPAEILLGGEVRITFPSAATPFDGARVPVG